MRVHADDIGAQYMCGRVQSFAIPATEIKHLACIPVEPNTAQFEAVKSSRPSQFPETQAIPEAEGQLTGIQMPCHGTL
ncbi:hypothetical protein NXS19_008988 [Fusarium pseudograminearum]|nr:hypothetical protein NXS19_008988 [Fusarium pseudograminearum]